MPILTTIKRRSVRVALNVLVGVLLLAWLMSLVDFAELILHLRQASVWWLLVAFAAFVCVSILEAGRIWLLFRQDGAQLGRVIRLFFECQLFANLLPGTIGADGYLIAGLRRVGVTVAAARIVFIRLLGVFVLVAMAVIASPLAMQKLLHSVQFGSAVTWPTVLGVSGMIAVGLLVLLISDRLRHWVLHRIVIAYRGVATISQRMLAMTIVTTFAMQAARALMFVALVVALGGQLAFSMAVLVAAAGLVARVLPISFSGLGVREAAIAAVLVVAGFSASFSIVVALLSRLLMLVGALIGMVAFLSRRKGWSVFGELT